jgi:hypothetical protein
MRFVRNAQFRAASVIRSCFKKDAGINPGQASQDDPARSAPFLQGVLQPNNTIDKWLSLLTIIFEARPVIPST